MERIDRTKTFDICQEAWKMAQMNNNFRFTVFAPIYEGEEVDYNAIGMNTFSTSWEKELISFDTQGFDTVEGQLEFDKCDTEALKEELGIDFEYYSDLFDGTIELSDDQKEKLQEWIDEQVEAELDGFWENVASEVTERIERKIDEWEKEHN